ncbi:farnesol dehydrogenase-like [Sitophilus oryzae]|uniref:Farnesol dehydrogenase-like n=1 Tax=Sitophilus oryzae TaxID=7048 RepID=A0A6J2X494_SITOR|nr:farnesol dehydrogenase-like [Sitophilus oryzae]
MTLSMEKWVGQVAVVTGSSAGIGLSITEKLVEHGMKVVGLARRKVLMEEHKNRWKNKKGTFHPVQCDITKESDLVNAFEWIKKNLGPVSVLINNAGKGGDTTLINGDVELWKGIFALNVLGLCIATREAINHMIESNINGHVIHINSIAGHYIPFHQYSNIYPASKFAVTALVETLRRELNLTKSKIKISDISPGLVNTEIANDLPSDSFLAHAVANPNNLKCEDIADAVIYVLSTPPHVQIHELIVKPVNEAW